MLDSIENLMDEAISIYEDFMIHLLEVRNTATDSNLNWRNLQEHKYLHYYYLTGRGRSEH